MARRWTYMIDFSEQRRPSLRPFGLSATSPTFADRHVRSSCMQNNSKRSIPASWPPARALACSQEPRRAAGSQTVSQVRSDTMYLVIAVRQQDETMYLRGLLTNEIMKPEIRQWQPLCFVFPACVSSHSSIVEIHCTPPTFPLLISASL